jgi:hypothetical protein
MSANEEAARGGFHFGNVGRDAKMNAGGDIVAGDKTVTTTTTTTRYCWRRQNRHYHDDDSDLC